MEVAVDGSFRSGMFGYEFGSMSSFGMGEGKRSDVCCFTPVIRI
jgi:hypothetical protein